MVAAYVLDEGACSTRASIGEKRRVLRTLVPRFANLAFDRSYLPLGSLLSGFFGGLSGSQGALRSAFLIHCGLSREVFVGTGVVSAVVVDLSRLMVYGLGFITDVRGVVIVATIAAFARSFLGARYLKKMTFGASR